MKKFIIINGPNLNLLGKREPEIYGNQTFNDFFEGLKSQFKNIELSYYQSNKLQLDFGFSAIYYDFNPGEINPTSENSSINPLLLDQKRAFENGLYASAEYKLSDKLTATVGLRYSYFIRRGGQPLTDYENGLPIVYNQTLGVY